MQPINSPPQWQTVRSPSSSGARSPYSQSRMSPAQGQPQSPVGGGGISIGMIIMLMVIILCTSGLVGMFIWWVQQAASIEDDPASACPAPPTPPESPSHQTKLQDPVYLKWYALIDPNAVSDNMELNTGTGNGIGSGCPLTSAMYQKYHKIDYNHIDKVTTELLRLSRAIEDPVKLKMLEEKYPFVPRMLLDAADNYPDEYCAKFENNDKFKLLMSCYGGLLKGATCMEPATYLSLQRDW